MKRSEMLDLMWTCIEAVENDYDVYMTKEDTERLLSVIEAAGMLPPRSYDRKAFTRHLVEGDSLHQWDNEDGG